MILGVFRRAVHSHLAAVRTSMRAEQTTPNVPSCATANLLPRLNRRRPRSPCSDASACQPRFHPV